MPPRGRTPPDDLPDSRRALTRRAKPVSGQVEDYRPTPSRDESDDYPTDADIERFSGVTVTCKNCGTEMYDDAEICWNCGEAVLGTAQGSGRPPMWIVAVAVAVAIALVAMWVL